MPELPASEADGGRGPAPTLSVMPIMGMGEVRPGDDLAELLVAAPGVSFQDGDVVVVTQKVVSKAEGRRIDCADPH